MIVMTVHLKLQYKSILITHPKTFLSPNWERNLRPKNSHQYLRYSISDSLRNRRRAGLGRTERRRSWRLGYLVDRPRDITEYSIPYEPPSKNKPLSWDLHPST